MTDEEIKKALECCKKPVGSGACNDCPLDKNRPCTTKMMESALDLINRQQEMIDGLIAGQETLQKALAEKNAEIERLRENNKAIMQTIADVHTEAIKEFIKKLKEKKHECGCNYRKKPVYAVTEEKIDETYKEMAGESK